MPRHVKLPNDTIVVVDQNDFITAKVEVDLSEFIDNDLEGVLDLLSERATGASILSDISYKVINHEGNALQIAVTGCISEIEIENVSLDTLPLTVFELEVTRIGYGARTIRRSARTLEEAIAKADDEAGNYTYPEHASDYLITGHPA